MRFEESTYLDIKRAAEEGYVAAIPLGSLEVHGPHLPVGIDGIVAHRIALEVAKREKVVVLPPLFYAYVPENRHFPGTVSLTAPTLLTLLREVCSELERMGFRKILIINGHGGNVAPLRVFLREWLWRGRSCVYAVTAPWSLAADVIERVRESRVTGHACEVETSIALYVVPELVRTDRIPRGEAETGPSSVVEGAETPVDWVAYAVHGFVGEPSKASHEKGEAIFSRIVERVAEIVRRIREDRLCEETLSRYRGSAPAV